MKMKGLLFITLLMSSVFTMAINEKTIIVGKNQGLQIKQQTFEEMDISFDVSEIKLSELSFRGQTYTQVSISDYIMEGKIGFPAMPAYKQLIEMPMDAEPEIIITSYEEVIIHLDEYGFTNKIFPLQPSLRKDQNPDDVPFYKNEDAYKTNDFISNPIIAVRPSGIAHNVNLARLIICPVLYNPVQNTIKIYKNIQCRILFKNANYAKTEQYKKQFYSPAFEMQFHDVLNHQTFMLKDQLTQYPISFLIISHRMFESTLQPFIQWKTRQGYKVTVGYTDVIGTTTTAIKNYITNIYNNGTPQNPAPSYLLLVGDVAQVPAFSGTTDSHATDIYYGTMNGSNDYIPDMYIGRFSATDTATLSAIINKTLEYEKYQMPDPSYLQRGLLIAGVDANNAPTYGNGQINYASQYYVNTTHNITPTIYLYDSGSPITSDNPQASPAIKQNISDGICFGNYTAHGSETGWADPAVSTSDITNFTNAHKYGLLIGNCCLTNKFDDASCFGESLLRAANKGSIGYIGGSNVTYWNEDYYYSTGVKSITANPTYDSTKLGFYDRLFHLFNEPTTKWFVSQAQINYGGNLAVEESSGGNNVYYWEIYHLMGDPTLLPYLGIPTPLTVNYLSSVPVGTPSLTIQTEPYSYVGLSYNNTWIDAKYTGTSNSVILDLSSITSPSTLDIVVTKQNRQPYIGTVILVPNTTPYVIYQSHVIHDSGIAINAQVEYSETVNMDVSLSNVGMQDANQVIAILSCTNPHIHLTDSTESYGTIPASQSVTKTNAFAFTVDTIITDQQQAAFIVTATDNLNNTWTTNFTIVLNAPVLNATTVVVNDNTGNNNGRLDPDEDATIKIMTSNTGHAISPNGQGNLSTTSSTYITINNNSFNLGQLTTSSPVYAEFPIHVDASTPIGTPVSFTYQVNASGYTATKLFSLTVGLIVEDFETGNFTHFSWDTTTSEDAPWIILNNGNIYEGNYAARSGVIGNGTYTNNTVSDLSITINVLSPDTLSFYKRVSSEQNYDFLQFFVDNNKLNEWSGEVAWSREAYYMTAGNHNLLWRYTKDYSVSNGDDAGYIDFIVFPPIQLQLSVQPTLSSLTSIVAFPNPCNDVLHVCLASQINQSYTLTLLNQLGQTVNMPVSGKVIAGKNMVDLQTISLPSGIYYMQVKTQSSSETLKVMVIK